MSKKAKTTQTQNQAQSFNNTSTYGWQTPPDTADTAAVRDFKFTADPSIGFTYGAARNRIASSFNNPIGGVYSPNMRDSILRSSLSDLAMRESQAQSEANQALQGQRFGQKVAVAGMMAPRLTQLGSSGTSSGTGTGTTVQSQSMLPDLLTGVATGAAS